MARITHFIAHDPITNSEGVVTEYDQELLSRASDSGIVFISVDEQGNRQIVPVGEVKEPDQVGGDYQIVQPLYVDQRMQAVVDVFDALSASVPAVAASADVQSASGESRSSVSFNEALENLRSLAYGTGEKGGE